MTFRKKKKSDKYVKSFSINSSLNFIEREITFQSDKGPISKRILKIFDHKFFENNLNVNLTRSFYTWIHKITEEKMFFR